MSAPLLTLGDLRAWLALGPEGLLEVSQTISSRAATFGDAFILAPLDQAVRDLLARCSDPSKLPLWGVPFVVGANIDVVGMATSVGIPALDFQPDYDAPFVENLRAAGALLVGKTAVDPLCLEHAAHGAVSALACGLAAFGIVSDRIGTVYPAAISDGLLAIRSSSEGLAAEGMFGAAPELDSIVVLATDLSCATAVRSVIENDCGTERERSFAPPTRLGVLGDETSALVRKLADQLCLDVVEIETTPFAEVASLVNDDTCLAIRLDDVATPFFELPELFPQDLRRRLSKALSHSSLDLVRSQRRLSSLCRAVDTCFERVDMLFVPPASDFNGFIGACRLAAVTLPNGGILVGRGGSDDQLTAVAATLTTPGLSRSIQPIDTKPVSPLAHR